jgi:3-(3-hydroxy-phenyl)propionate hydroxylase
MSTANYDYEVAIVGYGPSGVIAANFLGKFGIKTLVLERDRDLYSRARAVTVDGTTMRTFQALGLDTEAKTEMDITTSLRWKTYSGFEILRLRPGGEAWGHASSYMIFQPRLEATLRRGVERYQATIDLHFGEEFVTLEQDELGVTLTSRHVETEASASYRVKYLIGADGGSSKVRRALDINLEGETRSRTWIVVDAKIKRWWPERELLTFWSDPVRPAVDIPLALDHHRWEIPLGPDEKKEDFEANDVIWKLIKPMGITEENVEIVTRAFYNHHVREAKTWRKGRVLLAGDAAHLMPPWAGQGMQSGIRDATNITWKLRYILQYGVSDRLLDSYQIERQPHVRRVTASSVQLGKFIEAQKGIGQSIRNLVLRFISSVPYLLHKLGNLLGVPPVLEAGFFSAKPANSNPLGRMLPQPRVASQNGHRELFDHSLGYEFVVLGLDVDPRTVLTPAQKHAWDGFGARYLTVRSAYSEPKDDSDIVDFENELAPWFAATGARVVVVRPDRFIAASDNTSLDVPALS